MLNAVVLYSVGSPQTLTIPCLKDFLNRFLSDKLVVKMPRFLWQPILHSFILPTRPERLKERYGAIFDHGVNPYLAICERLAATLQNNLNQHSAEPNFVVKLSYAYCEPYLETVLAELAAQGCTNITLVPLFPQYSDCTSKRPRLVLEQFAHEHPQIKCSLVRSYVGSECYLDALADLTRSYLYGTGAMMNELEAPASDLSGLTPSQAERTHLLLAFHSLPKSYIRLGDPYLSEVEATVNGLKSRLQLTSSNFSSSKVPLTKAFTVLIARRFSSTTEFKPSTVFCRMEYIGATRRTMEKRTNPRIGVRMMKTSASWAFIEKENTMPRTSITGALTRGLRPLLIVFCMTVTSLVILVTRELVSYLSMFEKA